MWLYIWQMLSRHHPMLQRQQLLSHTHQATTNASISKTGSDLAHLLHARGLLGLLLCFHTT
jgi:hypothetical protein